MRVSMVIPYYGQLPKWLPLFLESAARNQMVHFLIVTDKTSPVPLPPNVSFVPMTLAEIEQRVRKAISPEFRFSHAYKLCDVRPFYGLVFEDLLQGSEFWGYCDVDLVFGDLSAVVNPGRLEGADFYHADAGPVVGTFCLYRNSARMNTFALTWPDYVRLLNSPESESVDEKVLTRELAQAGDIRHFRAESLRESQLSIAANGRMVGRTTGVAGDPTEFYWSNGHTFIQAPGHEAQEVMYLHFIGLKRSYHWNAYDPAVKYLEYSLSAVGFQPWRTPPSIAAAVRLKVRGLSLSAFSWCRGQVAARLSTTLRHRIKSWF